MKLKALNINFQNSDDFIGEIAMALGGKGKAVDKKNTITFDSIETFKRVVNQNKLEILMAISQLNPKSIYQLEKLIKRNYPAVLKDCRQLESLGFIKLLESNEAKKEHKKDLKLFIDLLCKYKITIK